VELGISRILTPASARDDEFLTELEGLAPDLCVTAAYGQYLPRRFLSTPRLGTLNLHPSLLPRWRGASPVQRSLVAGDTTTGISILYTVAKMDAGPIALQRSISLCGNETSHELLDQLFQWGVRLLVDETLPQVFSGSMSMESAESQDDILVTLAPLIGKDEGLLWPHNETARQMRDKIRGFHGWPGASLPLAITGSAKPPQGMRVKVSGTRVVEATELHPKDQSRPLEELVFFKARDGQPEAVAVRPATDPQHALLLDKFQIPGKKSQVSAKSFYKGYMTKQPARWTPPEEEAALAVAATAHTKKKVLQ